MDRSGCISQLICWLHPSSYTTLAVGLVHCGSEQPLSSTKFGWWLVGHGAFPWAGCVTMASRRMVAGLTVHPFDNVVTSIIKLLIRCPTVIIHQLGPGLPEDEVSSIMSFSTLATHKPRTGVELQRHCQRMHWVSPATGELDPSSYTRDSSAAAVWSTSMILVGCIYPFGVVGYTPGMVHFTTLQDTRIPMTKHHCFHSKYCKQETDSPSCAQDPIRNGCANKFWSNPAW